MNLNTASSPLLARVAGLSSSIADNVVALRDTRGAFKSRRELLEVPRLGERTFEQAAGFLRIVGGEDPLDASAVHPEAYPVVERILAKLEAPLERVMGQSKSLAALAPQSFVDE